MGGENREVAGLFKILLVARSEKKQVKSRHFNFFSYTTYCRAFRVRTLGACRRGTGVIAEPRLGEAKLKHILNTKSTVAVTVELLVNSEDCDQ